MIWFWLVQRKQHPLKMPNHVTVFDRVFDRVFVNPNPSPNLNPNPNPNLNLHCTILWSAEKSVTINFILVQSTPITQTLVNLDYKTIRIFAHSSTRERSNTRSGTRLKTENETDFFFLASHLTVRLERTLRLFCSLLLTRTSRTVFVSLLSSSNRGSTLS